MKPNLTTFALLSLTAGACAYTAPVRVSPNLNVYSSYNERVPGAYLLYVDSNAMESIVRPTGYTCSAHNFPVDAREAFKTSALHTVEQLVEEVELVERAVPASDLGGRGMIILRVESMSVRVQFIEQFLGINTDADAEIRASTSVDTNAGRIFGTTASGDGDSAMDAGSLCEGGAYAIARALEQAISEVLGQLGERMSNAPRLRGDGAIR